MIIDEAVRRTISVNADESTMTLFSPRNIRTMILRSVIEYADEGTAGESTANADAHEIL